MVTAQPRRRLATLGGGRAPLRYVGYGLLLAIVAAWAWRAFHDTHAYDTEAAWGAGAVAWHTGHPETLPSWTGMPFLAGTMAIVSRVLSIQATGELVTAINVILFGGTAWLLLRTLRPLLPPGWWWIAAFVTVSFVPLMSTVWWKQFNLITLALAAAGFELARRRRTGWAAAAIGLSIAIKPMVILLPFVMLARRDTRRTGILAIVWVIVLNIAAQALMAIRAGGVGPLDPLSGLRNIIQKTHPNLAVCHPINFSPQSLLCRVIGGSQFWTLQRITVWLLVLVLGLWVISALRGYSLLSWDAFAFVCALSAMPSPLEWSHYQLELLPLFLLLLFRFTREGASVGAWFGLLVALALTSLIWQPYGTLYGTIRRVLTGHHESYFAFNSTPEATFQEGIAQFAQYILLVTGALWYSARPSRGEAAPQSVTPTGRSFGAFRAGGRSVN